MTKLILGPIIGGLSPTSAYLWGRADGTAMLHAWVGRQPDLSDAELADRSPLLTQKTGFAGFAALEELLPETRYYYSLSLDSIRPSQNDGPFASFTTFPKEGEQRSFSFAFGSCFLPMEETPGQVFKKLEALRKSSASDPDKALQFLLLLGDQIYADDCNHNNLGCVARSVDDYRKVYAHTWSQPPFRDLLKNLPAFMTLDDHEVDDDWTWGDHNREKARIPFWDCLKRWRKSKAERTIHKADIQAALQAYWEHQGMHARGYKNLLDYDSDLDKYPLKPDDQTSFAYAFNYGAAAFFVLDTRTRRIKRKFGKKSMLGEDQWEKLETWLDEVKDTHSVKFIVTSCALLFRMWTDFPRDRWTGFPKERKRLLNFLAAHAIEGVYLLAGDLHSAHALSADLRGPGGNLIRLWEFCSSPFEQKTNWAARISYLPLMGKPVIKRKLHHIYDQYNFGVVRVDFADPKAPKVRFEIRGSDGKIASQVETSVS